MKAYKTLPLTSGGTQFVSVGGCPEGGWAAIEVYRATQSGRESVAKWLCHSQPEAERVLARLKGWAHFYELSRATIEDLHRKVAPELRA